MFGFLTAIPLSVVEGLSTHETEKIYFQAPMAYLRLLHYGTMLIATLVIPCLVWQHIPSRRVSYIHVH